MAMDEKPNRSESIMHERRRCTRFHVSQEILITFQPEFDRLGKVTDISKGGLGFEYVSFDRNENPEQVEVDVYAKPNLYISRIPCKIVYDISKDPFFILSNAETRRCGLQFSHLSSDHLASLSALLNTLC